jgi:DNA-binding transcriptional regulator YdaS (Cro superfamily)
MNLSDYLKKERGRAKLVAQELGVSSSLVAQWAAGKPVSVERCVAIERATDGAVTRRELRPADWTEIWPELAAA